MRVQHFYRDAAFDFGVVSLVDDAGRAMIQHRSDFVPADLVAYLPQRARVWSMFNRHGFASFAASSPVAEPVFGSIRTRSAAVSAPCVANGYT
jgi:hypothetical protein